MKILQIAPPWISTPPQNYGGTEVVIANLCKGLVELGHDVTLFATGNSDTPAKLKYVFEESLIEMDVDWNNSLPSIIHYNEAFKIAKDFDIVHTHLSSGTDLMILPLMDQSPIPSIMTIHSLFPFDRKTGMDDLYIEKYCKSLTAINISNVMQKYNPKGIESSGVVYNGVDLNQLEFNPTYNKDSYLTWVGKIIRGKGLHTAIDAAKKANEKMIFGGVYDKFVPETLEYWENEIKPRIDGEQIQYIGPVNPKQKSDLLKNAKGFLNPITWEEPFGMVMAESMACGTPVISYSRGAAKELIADGKTGFLINENIDEIVSSIKKLGEIDRKNCRQRVLDNFSIIAMAKNYCNYYEKLALKDIDSTNEKNLPGVKILKKKLKYENFTK